MLLLLVVMLLLLLLLVLLEMMRVLELLLLLATGRIAVMCRRHRSRMHAEANEPARERTRGAQSVRLEREAAAWKLRGRRTTGRVCSD